MRVSITEAKRKFSYILNLATLGVRVVITKRGKPVAKLIRIRSEPGGRRKFRFGSAKGEFTVPDDFNDPDPEIEDMFYEPDQ